MTLKIEKYSRKPFDVEAVKVTIENIDEVAEWCKGRVTGPTRVEPTDVEPYTHTVVDPTPSKAFIEVPVKWAFSEDQKQAKIGTWVVFANNGFKVYSDRAFTKSFELKDKKRVVHRDAGDGKFVTASEAAASPDTTTKENV